MLFRSVSIALWAAATVSAVPGPYFANHQNPEESSLQRWYHRLWDQVPQWSAFGKGDSAFTHLLRPPPPKDCPHHPDVEHKTIYQALKENERFSKLFRLVNFTDEITSVLNDSSAKLTFFALPDSAFPKHKPHRHGHHLDDEQAIESLLEADLESQHNRLEILSALEHIAPRSDDGDDDDKERRKKIFQKIIRAVLSYHILPESFLSAELVKNHTYATTLNLQDGSLDKEPERIRVAAGLKWLHPTLYVNIYSQVVVADIKTKNGIVHVINRPLFPPPSIFQSMFLLPEVFSTVTSALQRVGLEDAVDWRWVPGKGDEKGTLEGDPAVTFFAPTNKAFASLPKKLKAFLFSPFGQRALKKVLQYHIVPGFVLHTDWSHNASESLQPHLQPRGIGNVVDAVMESMPSTQWASYVAETFCDHLGCNQDNEHPEKFPKFPHGPELIFAKNYTLPTLLEDHTLSVHIAQYSQKFPVAHKAIYVTRMFAGGRIVPVPDITARNGAFHVVGRVLNPIKHGKGGPSHPPDHNYATFIEDEEAEWENWEEWLPQWANED